MAVSLVVSPEATAVDFQVRGQPLRLDITESLYLVSRMNPGNGNPYLANYYEGINRLNLQLSWGNFLFGTRLDSSGYIGAPKANEYLIRPGCNPDTAAICRNKVDANKLKDLYLQKPVGNSGPNIPFVEKIFASWTSKHVDVTLGDSYVQFGRGLVLSLRKLDELGFDTTVQGGKATVRAGDFSATLVGGRTNTQNLIEATSQYLDDPADWIVGGRADYRVADKVTIGLQGAGGKPRFVNDGVHNSSPLSKNDMFRRYGFTLDAPRPTKWLSLYGEYAHIDDVHNGENEYGNAYYASATVYAGKLSILGEFKSYTNFLPWTATAGLSYGNTIVYNAPPTLERVITQLSNNTDNTAGRLRFDYQLSPTLTVYASPEISRLKHSATETDTLADLYAGAQVRWGDGRSHAFPLLGYRLERSPEGKVVERLIAVEGSFVQTLTGPWSLELQGLVWFREKPDADIRPWAEGNIYLGLKMAPKLVVTGGYEFTTAYAEELNQHNFFNGSVTWNITPATSVRLYAGGQRSGLRCVSGLCRYFPAFQGGRLEVVFRG